MTTIYSSNFDSDSVGSLPAGWVNKVGSWAVRNSASVSGANSFGSTSNADGDVALYVSGSAIADMDVSYSFKQLASGTTYLPFPGIVLRSDAANANHYVILFSHFDSSGKGNILLFKKIGGTYSAITEATNVSLTQSSGSIIRARAKIVGSTISVYVGNGSLPSSPSATFTDTSITAPGYAGLYNGQDGQPVSMSIDDFFLADTVAASGSVPGAPTIGTATAANASATFPYTAPSSDGGSAITGYVLSVYYASDNTLVGNVDATLANPIVANGLVNGQAVYGKIKAVNAIGPGPQSAASKTVTPAASATANNALASSTAGVLFSPYNWDVQASSAKTINAGAYFKTIFGGTTCTMNFDMTGVANPLPQISYRVDRFGPWVTVPIAASVAIAIPSDTADYANKGGHLLEVIVKSMTETQARWSTQATAVKLTGIVLDAGKSLSAPPGLPLKGIFYGDSITEGVRTVNMTATNDTDRNDAAQSWAYISGQMLGAEVGIVGFGASGFIATGSGGVPPLPTSYNLLYSGVARSFAAQPDFIVLMEGTNDSGDVTSPATTVLNGLLSATTTTKIIVLRPFNGTAHALQLQAGVAACSAPSRVTYVDTAGWFTTANSSDNLHPYGVENITHIAPLAAASIRSVLNVAPSSPTLNTRTVTITLRNPDKSLAANLSGIKVAAFDEPLPSARTVSRFTSAAETTDVNGVMTFTMQSTLSSGAKCGVSVQMVDGSNFDVQATVA